VLEENKKLTERLAFSILSFENPLFQRWFLKPFFGLNFFPETPAGFQ